MSVLQPEIACALVTGRQCANLARHPRERAQRLRSEVAGVRPPREVSPSKLCGFLTDLGQARYPPRPADLPPTRRVRIRRPHHARSLYIHPARATPRKCDLRRDLDGLLPRGLHPGGLPRPVVLRYAVPPRELARDPVPLDPVAARGRQEGTTGAHEPGCARALPERRALGRGRL